MWPNQKGVCHLMISKKYLILRFSLNINNILTSSLDIWPNIKFDILKSRYQVHVWYLNLKYTFYLMVSKSKNYTYKPRLVRSVFDIFKEFYYKIQNVDCFHHLPDGSISKQLIVAEQRQKKETVPCLSLIPIIW